MTVNRYKQAADTLLKENNLVVSKVRSSMSGLAYYTTNQVEVPEVKSPTSFHVLAHEVGHQALGHSKKRKSCIVEYEAEMFALQQFKRFSFKVPVKVKDRINKHIAYGLAQALNRGMKQIPSELKPYKKYLYSSDCHIIFVRNGIKKYDRRKVWRVQS